jgi:Pentapeptide repeats (8 copies)
VKEVAGLANDSEHGEFSRGFFERRPVRVVGVVALFAVVVTVLFLLLNWYVAPTKPSERKDLVLAMAQILGGTALLSGLYFTWRTLQVNREGQITERFTRAIDQLGKVEDGQKLFEIRIGGIYALERIAKESEEDYLPIMEILTAYVRRNSPWTPDVGEEGSTEDATEEQSTLEGSGWKSETTEDLDPDIQAIMTVLQRRTLFYEHGEPESLDLHETNLLGADLSRANLRQANLSRANLTGADLSGAGFRGTIFSGANLLEAILTQPELDLTDGDENTKLPNHLKPPAHWGRKSDEQIEGDWPHSRTSENTFHEVPGTGQSCTIAKPAPAPPPASPPLLRRIAREERCQFGQCMGSRCRPWLRDREGRMTPALMTKDEAKVPATQADSWSSHVITPSAKLAEQLA